jgi:hypothetical protein
MDAWDGFVDMFVSKVFGEFFASKVLDKIYASKVFDKYFLKCLTIKFLMTNPWLFFKCVMDVCRY